MTEPIWRDYIISGDTEGVFTLKRDGEDVTELGLFVRPDKDHYDVVMNKLCEVLLENEIDITRGGTYTCPEAYGEFSLEDDSGNTLGSSKFRWDWSYEDNVGRRLSFPINGHADDRMRFVYTQFNEEDTYSDFRVLYPANITISGSGLNIRILNGRIISNANTITVPYIGGTYTFNVTSNTEYEVSETMTYGSMNPTSGDSGVTTFYLSMPPNYPNVSRSDGFSFMYYDDDANICHIEIHLEQEAERISIVPSAITIDGDGGYSSVDVQTNTDWVITVPSWLTPESSTSGTLNSQFGFTASLNSGVPRQGSIIVSGVGGSSASTLVSQDGGKYVLISPESIQIPSVGGTYSVSVTANTAWTVSMPIWITPIGPTSGSSGVSTFMFSVAENTGGSITDNIVFSASGGFSKSCTLYRSGYVPYSQSDALLYKAQGNISPNTTSGWGANIVSNDVWSGNSSWRAIIFDGTVTNIPDYAFTAYSLEMEAVVLPANTQSIGKWAFTKSNFYGTNHIEEIHFNDGLTSIGEYAFQYAIAKEINIPDSVTYIGNAAFANCYYLLKANIPSGVTVPGEGVFTNCSALTSMTISYGVKELTQNLLSHCKSLTSLTIPSSVTAITGLYALSETGFQTFEVPESITYLGWNVFMDCENLVYASIPSSVTFIDRGLFIGCKRLTGVTFNASVSAIPRYTFALCESLPGYTVHDYIETIDAYAFSGCTGMTNIIIGSGVTSIKDGVFFLCSSLSSITCYSPTAPSLGNMVFGNQLNHYGVISSTGTLYYPQGSDYSTWLEILPSGWVGVPI